MIEFLVQGSSAKPYKITFQKNAEHVYAGCSCSERKAGRLCKHCMNILDGDVTKMVEGASDDIDLVLKLIEGTRFLQLYNEYKQNLKIYNSKTLTEIRKALVTKPI